MGRPGADDDRSSRDARSVIDVLPVEPGVWLARCECGATEHFGDAETGWAWVLDHPCAEGTGAADDVIDLTARDAHTARD